MRNPIRHCEHSEAIQDGAAVPDRFVAELVIAGHFGPDPLAPRDDDAY
jgi:hypothetical protein